MKLHEYQSKQLLSEYGLPVPKGGVATSAVEAVERADSTGVPAVIKSQIHAGGRGKAGGILVASTRDEVAEYSERLLGSKLATHQTGANGLPVHAVLVEEAVQATQELYFGILVDTAARAPVIIASGAGGVDIEETAAKQPERVLTFKIDPLTGVLAYQARNLTYGAGLPHEMAGQMSAIAQGAYRLFVEKDCSLVEVNPLILTSDGRLLALDAKVTLDDSGLARHPDLAALRDKSQEDPLDARATDVGINYIKLSGDVGCLVNGAGLAMATMDLVKWAGGEPANFLDVGGGASEEQLVAALEMMLSDEDVKAAWVNIFGGILRCDLLASAIVHVLSGRDVRVPFIVRMNGTNLEQGMDILKQSGLPIEFEPDLARAARTVVAAAKNGGPKR